MPLYEYKCSKCGAVFETLQRFSDAAIEVHNGCGGPVERLISPPTFVFKGTGWYATDYAGKSNGSNGRNQQKPEPDSGKAAKPDSSTSSSTGSTSPPKT